MTGDGQDVENADWRYGPYRDEHPGCELLKYFPDEDRAWRRVPVGGKTVTLTMHDAYGIHIHHIWHVGNRFDRLWNLVNVCGPVHQFMHAYPQDGVVLATWHKLSVGEHDEANAFACLGFHPLGKVVAGYRTQFPWVRPFLENLRRAA